MKASLIRALLMAMLSASASIPVLAVEQGQLSGFRTDDSSLTTLKAPQEVARVRIPLRITSFEQVVIKNAEGIRRIDSKALSPKSFNFKSTINRSNHFYVNDWHVETVPTRWDRLQKIWQVDVRFYKRFGESDELEELVGSMLLKGRLEGKDMLYTMQAKANKTFTNKMGQKVLAVEINSLRVDMQAPIAIRDRPAAQ